MNGRAKGYANFGPKPWQQTSWDCARGRAISSAAAWAAV